MFAICGLAILLCGILAVVSAHFVLDHTEDDFVRILSTINLVAFLLAIVALSLVIGLVL